MLHTIYISFALSLFNKNNVSVSSNVPEEESQDACKTHLSNVTKWLLMKRRYYVSGDNVGAVKHA